MMRFLIYVAIFLLLFSMVMLGSYLEPDPVYNKWIFRNGRWYLL